LRLGGRRSRAIDNRRRWKTIFELCDRQTLNLVASFQRTMVNDLVTKTLAAAREYDVRTLFVSGGVAANRELRATFEREAGMQGLAVFFPSRALSTDNAAMIAAAAFPKFLRREFVAMDFSPSREWRCAKTRGDCPNWLHGAQAPAALADLLKPALQRFGLSHA
jgi:tRNA A37 threonylcarbamoyltransferase TsaD